MPAILARQVQVEKNQVGPRGVRENPFAAQKRQCFLAVADDVQVDQDLSLLEPLPGQIDVSRVVLDEENLHQAIAAGDLHGTGVSVRGMVK